MCVFVYTAVYFMGGVIIFGGGNWWCSNTSGVAKLVYVELKRTE